MSVSAVGTSLSGLQTYLTAINVTANNIANANTSGFQPQQASFQENAPAGSGVHLFDIAPASSPASASAPESAPSGTDLASEMVNLLMYKIGFEASAKALKTSDQLLGQLVDTKG